MLDEALRRRERGAGVVIGCVDAHDRPHTRARVDQLCGHRSPPPATDDLDVEQLVAASADVVLVDELAHRNRPGAARAFRWHDISVLLDAGIDVITTLTVQHIESLAEPVRDILGRSPDVVVPDDVLRRADQIELVDISPEAIRRRIAHGNVFAPDDLHPADGDLFNTDSFAALRALMLYWMADRLAAAPDDARGARETVVVALTDSPTSDLVLRRAARLAQRSRAPLIGVHVRPPGDDPDRATRRERVERLGGAYHQLAGSNVAAALLSFCETERATQLVLGARRRRRSPRWWAPPRPALVDEIIRGATSVDVHIVSVDADPDARRPGSTDGAVPLRRQVVAAGLGVMVLAALTAVLAAHRGEISVATSLSLYLLAVVGITAGGGAIPGLASAVASPIVVNWFLIPPFHTFRIAERENVLELLVFVSVATIVSTFVSIAAARAAEAERSRREASTLAKLTSTGQLDMPDVVVEQLRLAFRLDGVAVLAPGDGPAVLASSGDAPTTVGDADAVHPLSSGFVVVTRGPTLGADDHRVLRAFLGQLSRALEQQRLHEIAAEADALSKADELRTALLRAVSHDLRSPLASIKASVSSMRQSDVEWPADIQAEFLASIEAETDRLTSIVTNLLDLSRLEAGVLRPVLRIVSVEEVVPASLHAIGPVGSGVVIELPADLPDVQTDPALLDRVVANLVLNALRWSPPHVPVRVRAHAIAGAVQVHVIDHGPGIPTSQRSVVVQPFHRLDDSGTGGGLGLGLAIADRFVAAMGGHLELRDTPGGGLTVVVTLPATTPPPYPRAPGPATMVDAPDHDEVGSA
jgi:two-component system, OmpR family, sensor histidine kinase KdpD